MCSFEADHPLTCPRPLSEHRLKEAQTAQAKKPAQPLVAQIEQLESEIHELSLGLGEKRIEAVRESQDQTWAAYGEVSLSRDVVRSSPS